MERVRQAPRRPDIGDDMPRRLAEPWWWLRMTSSGWDTPDAPLEEREMTRRSRLLAWITLGMLVCGLLVAVTVYRDQAALLLIGLALAGTLGVIALNRAGFVTAAGTLAAGLLVAAPMGAILVAPGHALDSVHLPAFGLLALAVLVAACVLPREAIIAVAALTIGLICADAAFQPKSAELLRLEGAAGWPALLAPAIALQLVVAAVAFLWVRGTDAAVRRADHADEVAAIEQAVAYERAQFEQGAQHLLETYVRAANGDYAARAPMSDDHLLWQIGTSLNNLLSRLQRTAEAEHQLRRTEDELRRLAAAMDDARLGRRPVWPPPAGTAADLIIERLPTAQQARQEVTGHLAAVAPPQPPHLAPPPRALTPPAGATHPAHYAPQRSSVSGQLGQLPEWLRALMDEPAPSPLGGAASRTTPLPTPAPQANPRSRWPEPTRPAAPRGVAPGPWREPTSGADAQSTVSAAAAGPTPADDWPEFLRAIGSGTTEDPGDEPSGGETPPDEREHAHEHTDE